MTQEEFKNKLEGFTGTVIDFIDSIFHELVPSTGPADTVAGEVIRAVGKVGYRYYNDGDVYYQGYGLETAAPSMQYILDFISQYGEKDDQDKAEKLVQDQMTQYDDRKYEVNFYDDNYEYEVDINYNNGKVESFEKDIRDDGITNNNTSNVDTANTNNNSNVANAIGNSSNTTNTTNNGSEYIGEDGAREIALAYAGINNSNDVRFSKIELDVDRNVSLYEIEFYYNNIEYDYEINAQTGEVLKYEKGY